MDSAWQQFDSAWAARLAHEVAPDEEPLATVLLEDYMAAPAGSLPKPLAAPHGSFSPGFDPPLLMFMFKAIASAGPLLNGLLSSESVFKVLEACGGLLTIAELSKHAKNWLSGGGEEHKDLAGLAQLCDVLPRELIANGVPADQAQVSSLRILKTLLSDPQSASHFVQRLQKK